MAASVPRAKARLGQPIGRVTLKPTIGSTGKGLKRASRSTVAKSRDRPGRAERRQALYNRAQEVDTALQEFALLPNNFNPDLPPRRRLPLLRRVRESPVTRITPTPSRLLQQQARDRPSSGPGQEQENSPKGQEQGKPLLSLTRQGKMSRVWALTRWVRSRAWKTQNLLFSHPRGDHTLAEEDGKKGGGEASK